MNNESCGPSENSQIIIENPEPEQVAEEPIIELKKEEDVSPNKGQALNKKQLKNLDLDDIFSRLEKAKAVVKSEPGAS